MVRGRIQITLFALLLGCSPAEPGVTNDTDAAFDGGFDEAGNPIVIGEITVHVAGYLGQGLKLTIDGTQELAVPSDGIWKVPLEIPTMTAEVSVLQQPTLPDQSCDVLKLDVNIFTVSCHEQRWPVSGTITGLSGKGLQLALLDNSGDDADGEVHQLMLVAAGGAFSFSRPLPDKANYEVRVITQPTSPRQVCTVSNGAGFTDETVINNVAVACVTETYVFTTVVTGLLGSGLTVRVGDGTVYPIEKAGILKSDARIPDGFRYQITINTQPVNPLQVCYIDDGVGVVDGADVTYNIICDALGDLQVSEVGACPFDSSSCWFEIYNRGAVAEEVAFYKLRTSARSPSGVQPSRVFALPRFQVPAGGNVVIHGKTAGAMADGEGAYHIASDDAVPWWGKDGFVELINPAGATVSFVRFGSSTMEPTTGGFWTGVGASALPVGTTAYGYSLQHLPRPGPYTAELWKLTDFATYCGINDSVMQTDVDRDGIPDEVEMPGATFAGMDLYAMGARVGARDVFVEVDHMGGTDPATTPRKEALSKVVDAFMRHNVVLHFDVGGLYSPSFDPQNYNLGGGTEVAFASAVGLAPSDPLIANLYDYKAANMAARRRMIFHYLLFGWTQQSNGMVGSSGVGELPGNDALITLGGLGLSTADATQLATLINYQAVSIMHELGHNFGLRHGGGDQLGRKPNYLSVMNYLYSPQGLATIGNAEGDRFSFYKRCGLTNAAQLTNPPNGDITKFLIDYSSGTGANLVESAVFESTGLKRNGSAAVDFNCNGRIDDGYALDLNSDGTLDTLSDHDDWAALDLVFRRSKDGAENGPSLRYADNIVHDDVLTADTVHRTDDPCP